MGHKTNGGWDDVTSTSRNDIVFEGRFKDYGAYYIRQRYNYTLLIGLLFTVSAMALIAGVPMIIQMFAKPAPLSNNNPPEKEHKIFVVHYDIKKPTPPPPPAQRTPPPPPPTNTRTDLPPVVTTNPPPTNPPTQHQLAQSNPGETDTHDPNLGHEPEPPAPPAPPTPPAPPAPPVNWAEVMPKFPGDMNNYIMNHVNYPEVLKESGVEGTVYVSFIIEQDGTISGIKIMHGVAGGPQLDKATMDVIQSMPKWSPGSQGGHPVRVQLVLPVHFQLK